MHNYFANLYEIECVSQHYHRTLENISIWDITDHAYGLLCLSISRDLLFHLDGLTSPNEVWENLQSLFGNAY